MKLGGSSHLVCSITTIIDISFRNCCETVGGSSHLVYSITRGTDFLRSRNRGKAYLKRNSRFSAKTLLIT